jgi:hypothetical protein
VHSRRTALGGPAINAGDKTVNDPFVMKAWGAEHGALGKVVMLADGNATFTKALGIEVDLAPAGPRRLLRPGRRGHVDNAEPPRSPAPLRALKF